MNTELNRKLLLIMNPGRVGANYVPTVLSVIERYKNFFKSPAGGYWQKDEILELSRLAPQGVSLESELVDKMRELNKKDVQYSVIVFVGHGAAANGIDSIQTEDGRVYRLEDFLKPIDENPNFKRMVIVDACRSFAPIQPNQILLEERSFSAFGTLDGEACKKHYNDLIADAEPHVSLVQSTQRGHYAYGTQTGTAFSDAALNYLKRVSDFYRNSSNAPGTDHIAIKLPKMLNAISGFDSVHNQTPQFTTDPIGITKHFPILAIHRSKEKRIECPEQVPEIIED